MNEEIDRILFHLIILVLTTSLCWNLEWDAWLLKLARAILDHLDHCGAVGGMEKFELKSIE